MIQLSCFFYTAYVVFLPENFVFLLRLLWLSFHSGIINLMFVCTNNDYQNRFKFSFPFSQMFMSFFHTNCLNMKADYKTKIQYTVLKAAAAAFPRHSLTSRKY